MPTTDTTQKSTWGRTSPGGTPALAIAIPVGILLALGVALVAHFSGALDADAAVTIPVFTLACAGPLIGLAYALVVDRDTLKGSVARPEDSVEARWFEQAAAGSFTDLLFLGGVGAVVASFTSWQAEVNLVLGGALLVAFVSFAVRYALIRARA